MFPRKNLKLSVSMYYKNEVLSFKTFYDTKSLKVCVVIEFYEENHDVLSRALV